MQSVKGRLDVNSHQSRELPLDYGQNLLVALRHQVLGILAHNESPQRRVTRSDSAGEFGVDPGARGELTPLRLRNQEPETVERMIDGNLPINNHYGDGGRVGNLRELGGKLHVGGFEDSSGERRRQSDNDVAISSPVVVDPNAPPAGVTVHRGRLSWSHGDHCGRSAMNPIRQRLHAVAEREKQTTLIRLLLAFAAHCANQAAVAALVFQKSREHAYGAQLSGIAAVNAGQQWLGYEIQHCIVKVISNNPLKLRALEEAGLKIVERVSIEVDSTEDAADYLRTKKEKLGHLLELKR